MKDYYKILGVPQTASLEDIRSAYRKLARESHPDVIRSLSPEEKKIKEEKMYDANEAYSVVSDSKKRVQYDQTREQARESVESKQGGVRTSAETFWASPLDRSFEDFFRDMVAGSGIFGGSEGIDELLGVRRKKSPEIAIPVNDWGLLVALKMAYESEVDGKWTVKKSETDKRGWVPDELYRVKREKGNVSVFRRVVDWRDERFRDKPLEVSNDPERKTVGPKDFLGEYYLAGKGRINLDEYYCVPLVLGEYLGAMKSLAKKLATRDTDKDGRYDVSREVEVMNMYGSAGARNTRVEGGLYENDENKEWVKKVSFDDFWKRLKQAEGRVNLTEWTYKTNNEGASKSTPFHGSSGESKG